jgi:hypothetical protein
LNHNNYDIFILFFFRGTHKERFDDEGHGKGKEGRSDEADATGYVHGFKGSQK